MAAGSAEHYFLNPNVNPNVKKIAVPLSENMIAVPINLECEPEVMYDDMPRPFHLAVLNKAQGS